MNCKRSITIITFFTLLLLNHNSFSQELQGIDRTFTYSIKANNSEIKIDGIEEENEWSDYDVIDELKNHYPLDYGVAERKTFVKLTYNMENLYVFVKYFDNGKRHIQSVALDNSRAHWDSDSFTVTIDPMNQSQNGFMFGVNAGGAMIEAALSNNGSETIYTEAWDNKWKAVVKQYENYWIAEISIPFKSLRFKKENHDWGINFVRNDMYTNYDYTWTPFPVNYGSMDLNFMGTLHWSENIPNKGKRYSLEPYAIFSSFKEISNNNTTIEDKLKVGINSKIAITSSLNLDLTLNPDFSNADADDEVTNISRFDLFLPEKRSFFIENDDIFSNFGSELVQPFYSRKIGFNNGTITPILFGARLSGNLANNTRIGVMNVRTSDVNDSSKENYSIAAIHQKVFERSIFKAFFINKHQLNDSIQKDYMNNFGAEFNFISKNQKFNNSFRLHSSNTEEKLNNNFYYGTGGNYNSRRFSSTWDVNIVGENYITDLGINPRLENYNAETGETSRAGFININQKLSYRFFNEKLDSKLSLHELLVSQDLYYDNTGWSLLEVNDNLVWNFIYKNTSSLTIDYNFRKVHLSYLTNILGGNAQLPSGSYQFSQYGIAYETDNRKISKSNIRVSYGNFFNGKRLNFNLEENFRLKSWGNFGISYNYNHIDLASQGFNEDFHLLRLKSEISFTNNLFWNTTVQKNSQNNNFSIYTRLQWRFLPMSDLFIIFNDNHDSENFKLKNKGVILKLTYWL